MSDLLFKLEVFEGPLDLMLHLIKKHKLNIYDIEISILLEQYLNYINEMKAQDLEVSSSFLEAAAQLVYLKTCSLLPKNDEEEKLKAELTGRLLQLDLVKQVAQKMRQICRYGDTFSRTPAKISIPATYQMRHDVNELSKAYCLLIDKVNRRLPPKRSAFSNIVEHKIVSVASRVIFVLRKLYRTGSMSYSEFFQTSNRSEKVATFLAMLELVKSKRIRMSADNSTVIFERSGKRIV